MQMHLKKLTLKPKETDNVEFKLKHINSVKFALMNEIGKLIWTSNKTYPTKDIKVVVRRFIRDGENCKLTFFFWKESRKISFTRKNRVIEIESVL